MYVIHILIKDFVFESISTWAMLLVPLASFSVWSSHQFLYKSLFIKFQTFNKFTIYMSLLIISFITFFALLELNIDYSSVKALKIEFIISSYSGALILMELVFSNKIDCYVCGKEL